MNSVSSDAVSPLTIALPKGRLLEGLLTFFHRQRIGLAFEKRKLVTETPDKSIIAFLVKNSDLPTYVHHGIAGLGVCGDDVLYESGYAFYKLHTFDFGGSTICLAGRKGGGFDLSSQGSFSVATKFPHFTRSYFHRQGIPVEIIRLNGSVELAPLLGLTPYIVDIVETGNTLRANDLEVLQELAPVQVHLIANPAYYKLYYKSIDSFLAQVKKD